jgi:hypothetical protein
MSCTPNVNHQFTAGDNAPPLACAYKTAAGVAIPITGWTIALHVERPTTPLVRAAVITDGPNGLFQVLWSTGDLVPGGGQLCRFVMTDTGLRTITTPDFTIDVREAISP